MKQIYFCIGLFMAFTHLKAQEAQIEQINMGAGYAQFVYYTLSDGSSVAYDHESWDIAFSVAGRDLGVFVNEGVGLSNTEELPEVALYQTSSTDFANVDTSGMVFIHNNDKNWQEGAFNHLKNEMDPFDFGWGSYNSNTRTVDGTRIFCIKLRDGSMKKLSIESLISGVYTIKYADLDGSNEETHTIDKANYPGKTLAYFSLADGMVKDLEPASWDFLMTQYMTPLQAGPGVVLEYRVIGVLQNSGVEVAQADGIDPATVDPTAYEEAYSSELTTIGYDWKTFNRDIFQYEFPTDRVYFIKDADNELWKVQFIDFEGSSTGVSTLSKTLLGTLTSTNDIFKHINSFDVYPNPVINELNVAFELDSSVKRGQIILSSMLGQRLWEQNIDLQNGLNVKTIPVQLNTGVYTLSMRVGKEIISKPLYIK